MKSAIYHGQVRHRRLLPRKHIFNYSIYMTWLDLDDVQNIFTWPLLIAKRGPACIKFERSNFHGPEDVDLKESIRNSVSLKTDIHMPREHNDKVFVLNNLNYFGFGFNPVSFYVLFRENDCIAILAEITNTPWGEKFHYVLDMRGHQGRSRAFHFDKNFHISPFMPMDINYVWHFRLDPSTGSFSALMQNFQEGIKIFDVVMNLKKKCPLSRLRLMLQALRSPIIPVQFIVGIYWNALRLYLKKIPLYSHPKYLEESTHD